MSSDNNKTSGLQKDLIENYIKPAGVTDKRVLNAFLKIPRHKFVPAKYRHDAYLDIPLPIGKGQTISQPSLVAVMTQALELKGSEKVLEIGTGSGFQAAILSKLSKEVYTTEIIPDLAEKAQRKLASLGLRNIHVRLANGSTGLSKYAPYDAIIVTAAANNVPLPLIHQLKKGGRIIIPVGDTLYGQQLRIGKKVNGTLKFIDIEPVAFVPLRGRFGWEENFGALLKKQNKQKKSYVYSNR
jgi:protein-L-isoaspartate(D-aspartate) O-methyltransferase